MIMIGDLINSMMLKLDEYDMKNKITTNKISHLVLSDTILQKNKKNKKCQF